jgi:DNA-binding NarL/FixJ family response regulator
MKDCTSLLVVIEPGRKLESLRVLLQGFDQIDRVLETKGVVSAWKVMASESPDFVLIDMDLPNNESWQFLEKVKNGSHCIQIIALASDSRQVQAVQQAGANSVLITGFSATDLQTALEPLQENVSTREPLHRTPTSNSTGSTSSITWEMLLKGDHDFLSGTTTIT